MRALIVYAHPCAESFSAAVHTTVLEALTDRGWEIDDCDLNAEGFQPVMTVEERRNYHTIPDNTLPVETYVNRLRAAEALIMIFPIWNFGYPAILKGFLDRVFLPGVTFNLKDGEVQPGLTNIKRLAAFTTYGGTRMRALITGDPPRKCVTRAIRYACGRPKTLYFGLYDMNNNGPEVLNAHLGRVRQKLQRF